jgi:PPM family protein phosphatase
MIEIKRTASISEKGKRENNEDNHGFDLEQGVFIVCDGVGGVEKGEVASEQTVKSLLDTLATHQEMDTQTAVTRTEVILSAYIQSTPDAMGMATTLTMTRIRREGIEVSWIGDSRVYQFRDGRIIFRTEDHSWVNDAVRAGILTAEEAVNHPKSNIITRALQGTHKPTVPEVVLIRDLEPGDIFLQCSDGVLESWDDSDLNALFNSDRDIDSVIQKLSDECAIHSRDNYTALIYEVGKVDIVRPVYTPQEKLSPSATHTVRQEVGSEINMRTADSGRSFDPAAKNRQKQGLIAKILSTQIPVVPSIIILFTLAVGMYFFMLKPMMGPNGDEPKPKINNSVGGKKDEDKINKKDTINKKNIDASEDKEQNTGAPKDDETKPVTPQTTDGQTNPDPATNTTIIKESVVKPKPTTDQINHDPKLNNQGTPAQQKKPVVSSRPPASGSN